MQSESITLTKEQEPHMAKAGEREWNGFAEKSHLRILTKKLVSRKKKIED